MKVQLLVRDYGQMIGLSRYDAALAKHLLHLGVPHALVTPNHPWWVRASHRVLRHAGLDVLRFFTTYPLAASLSPDRHTVKHITAQNMSALLCFHGHLQPVVITVHDIVPHLVRHDRSQSTYRHPADFLFDALSLAGLRRATALIAISQYTKQTLVNEAGCAEHRIRVIHQGVDHDLFRPQPVPQAFRERWGLSGGERYVLYVGSENPRKNLPRLIEAFAQLRGRLPNVRLLKVGSSETPAAAEGLRRFVRERGLERDVLIHGAVSEGDLVLLYNLADLFVFPSLYEGFGLPPLEAMACGTPVVCSNAASLPEVVGDAALTVDPYDVGSLAEAMRRVLADDGLRRDLSAKSLARAAEFTWERTAEQTIAVYRELLAE